MTTPTNPDDNAYPNDTESSIGLTKREYFAALAMQGYLSFPGVDGWTDEQLATYAVSQADALIAALNKPTE